MLLTPWSVTGKKPHLARGIVGLPRGGGVIATVTAGAAWQAPLAGAPAEVSLCERPGLSAPTCSGSLCIALWIKVKSLETGAGRDSRWMARRVPSSPRRRREEALGPAQHCTSLPGREMWALFLLCP